MSLIIRRARADEAGLVHAFVRELADYEKLLDACVATEELLRKNLFGPERAAEALVALNDNAIVGYAIYFKTFSTFLARPGLYLEDIYVQPQHRGKGLGKGMLREIARTAVTRNYGRVEWCVLDWNAPSIAFYKSLGAFPMDEWTIYRLTGDALQKFGAA